VTFNRSRLEALLAGCPLGRPLHLFDRIESTNDECKRLAEAGAPAGTLVLAWEQTRGRGRLERSWHSPPGAGLYLSVLLRPGGAPESAAALPGLAARAVADALAAAGVPEPRVVPPNDVLTGGRKIAGVLVEPRVGARRIDFAVVGIGVNLGQAPGDWAAVELRRPATSCSMEGVRLTVEAAAASILNALAEGLGPAAGVKPAREGGSHDG
jgi:BirA family biotin operon repressor/biotin-[acetyl-CoA-carboxylase] ligase